MISRCYTTVIVMVRFSSGGWYFPSMVSASRCFSTRSCGALLSPPLGKNCLKSGDPVPGMPIDIYSWGASTASSWRRASGVGLLLKAAYIERTRHCVELWGPRSRASMIAGEMAGAHGFRKCPRRGDSVDPGSLGSLIENVVPRPGLLCTSISPLWPLISM